MIAPHNMRSSFNDLIDQEIAYQQSHGNGKITAKMNALEDGPIIRKLYEAAQAGVQIDLIIRGHTQLRPGSKRVIARIFALSVFSAAFLEHDRIFCFHNNEQPAHLHRLCRLAKSQPK